MKVRYLSRRKGKGKGKGEGKGTDFSMFSFFLFYIMTSLSDIVVGEHDFLAAKFFGIKVIG